MTQAVLDASVLLKWFAPQEHGATEARVLRNAYEIGDLEVLIPSLAFLEILNIAARKWGHQPDALIGLALELDDLGFAVLEPDLSRVAHWAGQGLTAYDSAYVALAQQHGIALITDDATILRLAPDVAVPLVPGPDS